MASVCAGRVCSSRGSALVRQELCSQGIDADVGGCFGLCDWGVNVVVRSTDHQQLQILEDDDVYCGVRLEDVAQVSTISELATQWQHLSFDAERHPSNNPIAARIALVRMRRQRA
jgi:hypothetical protein